MGLRLTSAEGVTAMFDSVTGWAFGPVFEHEEDAEAFMGWARTQCQIEDLRSLSSADLFRLWEEYNREQQARAQEALDALRKRLVGDDRD